MRIDSSFLGATGSPSSWDTPQVTNAKAFISIFERVIDLLSDKKSRTHQLPLNIANEMRQQLGIAKELMNKDILQAYGHLNNCILSLLMNFNISKGFDTFNTTNANVLTVAPVIEMYRIYVNELGLKEDSEIKMVKNELQILLDAYKNPQQNLSKIIEAISEIKYLDEFVKKHTSTNIHWL